MRISRLSVAEVCLGLLVIGVALFAQAEDEASRHVDHDRAVIEAALDKSISLSVTDQPLDEVLVYLSDKAKVPILVDRSALEEVGLSPDVPVSGELYEISLRNVLALLLRSMELVTTVEDGVLLVTTPERSELLTEIAYRDVRDLVASGNADSIAPYDFDSLVELVSSVVAPDTWDSVGGPGSCNVFDGGLVIRQGASTIRELDQLLAKLRAARRELHAHPDSVPETPCLFGSDSFPRLRNALTKEISVEFAGVELREAVEFLRESLGINIVVDHRALDDVGLSAEVPVTLSSTNMSLEQTLRHLLRPLNLQYVLRHEVILITTSEEAEAVLPIGVYPVADLCRGDQLSARLGADAEAAVVQLTRLVAGTVVPQMWAEVGGPAVVKSCPQINALVVRNTPDGHRLVLDFLTQLRQGLATRKDDPNAVPATAQVQLNAQRVVGVYYLLQRDNANKPVALPRMTPETVPVDELELTGILRNLLGQSAWDEPQQEYMLTLPGRLIVSQTTEVHAKLRYLLAQLRIPFQYQQIWRQEETPSTVAP